MSCRPRGLVLQLQLCTRRSQTAHFLDIVCEMWFRRYPGRAHFKLCMQLLDRPADIILRGLAQEGTRDLMGLGVVLAQCITAVGSGAHLHGGSVQSDPEGFGECFTDVCERLL